MDKPEKHLESVKEIAECQRATRQTYGYRRVTIWLKNKGMKLNPKTILRLMNKYNLLACIRRNRKYQVMSQ
ncbi:MAG: transposase, partial [Ruminococcaceae bacterium]|nr:transposase [Oscillospiraceae bacterium]